MRPFELRVFIWIRNFLLLGPILRSPWTSLIRRFALSISYSSVLPLMLLCSQRSLSLALSLSLSLSISVCLRLSPVSLYEQPWGWYKIKTVDVDRPDWLLAPETPKLKPNTFFSQEAEDASRKPVGSKITESSDTLRTGSEPRAACPEILESEACKPEG